MLSYEVFPFGVMSQKIENLNTSHTFYSSTQTTMSTKPPTKKSLFFFPGASYYTGTAQLLYYERSNSGPN